MDSLDTYTRDEDEVVHTFISPWKELNAGLWLLFAGATFFLGLRIWVKLTRRHGLWYDDWILIVTWVVLLANNSLIVWEFANGYILKDSAQSWDDRMHILINVSSCGTLIGQAWSKTAFGVTLLRMGKGWQLWVLWYCIGSMNIWMILKVIFQWAKVCGKDSYQQWYRLDFCIGPKFRADFKEGGNVYNIIMDFIFASFPWLMTRSLEMRRIEKVGLCLTMSLGMVVAIVAAIRVGWKDEGNSRDAHYIWRNGLSQVWYSSEITGTIMVQCIPILRPILRDFHTSLTSKKLGSSGDGLSTRWSSQRASAQMNNNNHFNDNDRVELGQIPEESSDSLSDNRLPLQSPNQSLHKSPSETFHKSPSESFHKSPPLTRNQPWPLFDDDNDRDQGHGKSIDVDQDRASHSSNGFDFDFQNQGEHGLSPPPPRKAQYSSGITEQSFR